MRRLSLASLRRTYLTGATLVRRVPISVVLIGGTALMIWTHHLLSQHRDLVVHTHEVIETAKDVLIGLDDAETGQRGYLLSGERRYLEPFAHAQERLGIIAVTLQAKVADNAGQTGHMNRLSGLMQKKLDELQAAVAARGTQGLEAALAMVLSSIDQATMDAIRHEIGQITEGETTLLATRGVEVQADERCVQLVAVLIGLASLLNQGRCRVLPDPAGQQTVPQLELRAPVALSDSLLSAFLTLSDLNSIRNQHSAGRPCGTQLAMLRASLVWRGEFWSPMS